MLKDKAETLSKSKSLLFGNEFRDHIVDSSKAKRKSIEAFHLSSPAKEPFREGPSSSNFKTAFRSSNAPNYHSQKGSFGGLFKRNRGQRISAKENKWLLKESPPFCNTKELPQLMNLEELTQVHETVRNLFAHLEIQEMPLAGRLRHFLQACEILTQDKQILSIVRGFEIPFLSVPFQEKVPVPIKTNLQQEHLIDVEVSEMLRKVQSPKFCRWKENSWATYF